VRGKVAIMLARQKPLPNKGFGGLRIYFGGPEQA